MRAALKIIERLLLGSAKNIPSFALKMRRLKYKVLQIRSYILQ